MKLVKDETYIRFNDRSQQVRETGLLVDYEYQGGTLTKISINVNRRVFYFDNSKIKFSEFYYFEGNDKGSSKMHRFWPR